MKKLLPIALVMILAINLGLLMIPSAFAEHEATVTWVESGSDTLAVSPILWPRWLNFTVYNNGPDGITEVKFVIQKDGDGNALFKFENSKHSDAAVLWTAIPDEFGPDGYPTVVYFRAQPSGTPIEMDYSGEFDILFSDGPSTCNYKFDIWTADDGTPSGVGHEILKIIIDTKQPILDVTSPTAYEEAIFDPYPNEWYLWIKFTAKDDPDHDSNISRVIVDMLEVGDDPDWEIDYDYPYEPEVVFEEKYWNLDDGNYTLVVTAYDGAGNSVTKTVEFEFVVPLKVWFDPDKGTVGPLTTYNSETGVYTGSRDVYPAVEGTKVLGTEVKILTKSGAFTPDSKVDVLVHGLPYAAHALVLKEVPTDSEGKFSGTPSFLFPTAPHGVYTVTLEDDEDTIVPLEFTVIPEIVYNPPTVIGPAPIEVIATGLPANGHVVGLTCDGTDALLGVNLQTIYEGGWYIDKNGTLQTMRADKPGLLMPVLEPGTYEIGLNLMFPEDECHETSISNLVAVVNDFKDLMDLMDDLEVKLDYLKPIIERIDGNVVTIKTDVGTIKADVEDIHPMVETINDNVVTIKTDVGNIEGTVTSIQGDTATVKTDVGEVNLKADEILDEIEPADPILTSYLPTVMSAIAAIAAIAAVVVVLRRLKVAA